MKDAVGAAGGTEWPGRDIDYVSGVVLWAAVGVG